ncbi:CLUMA_CG016015, isoform A [Clunio marinus]|uniref:CLUMA_CG016015, isoform A n=1 Tax=Clunio marinus TaxID=568069 RepID=A0A1J1IRB4_9DIPT|nr:CLUMA_CG016015, isoform A [Clunio marinus]
MLWSSALVMCTAGVFVPFINHKLPYKVWFPFETDIEKNELGFWVASFLVVFNSFFGSAIDMALDILPVTFMAFEIGLLDECTGVFTLSITKSITDFIKMTTFMVLEIFLPCYIGRLNHDQLPIS